MIFPRAPTKPRQVQIVSSLIFLFEKVNRHSEVALSAAFYVDIHWGDTMKPEMNIGLKGATGY